MTCVVSGAFRMKANKKDFVLFLEKSLKRRLMFKCAAQGVPLGCQEKLERIFSHYEAHIFIENTDETTHQKKIGSCVSEWECGNLA